MIDAANGNRTLGADVDAARRLVQNEHARVRDEAAAKGGICAKRTA